MILSDKEIEKRKHLVRSTYKLIAEQGFSNITLQDVADAAGVSKGSILYYFENKDELFVSLLEWLVNRIERHIRVEVSKADTPEAKLQAYVDATFVGIKENKEFYRVFLDFLSQSNHNDALKRFNVYFYNQCGQVMSQIIAEGSAKGVFRAVPFEESSVVVRSIIDGLCIRWLFDDTDKFPAYKGMALRLIQAFLKP